jgi:hypothetical protein
MVLAKGGLMPTILMLFAMILFLAAICPMNLSGREHYLWGPLPRLDFPFKSTLQCLRNPKHYDIACVEKVAKDAARPDKEFKRLKRKIKKVLRIKSK